MGVLMYLPKADTEQISGITSLLGQIPTYGWVIIGVIGIIIAISLIKKALKLAITIGILVVVLSSMGIISNKDIENAKQSIEQSIDQGKGTIEKGQKAIEEGQQAVEKGKDLVNKVQNAENTINK
jgi:hypothetical protein